MTEGELALRGRLARMLLTDVDALTDQVVTDVRAQRPLHKRRMLS